MAAMLDCLSGHFTLERLADGVYAALHIEGGSAICNAGLMDLGGLVVVFDTFLTPQAAVDLKQCAISLFGGPPQVVINSHYHNDHIWGNQAFAPDALIVSSDQTRLLLDTEGKDELDWYRNNSDQQLTIMLQRYQDAIDEPSRTALLGMLGYYRGLVDALPTLTICKANTTFNGSLSLHGKKRTAELITFEGAHTASDTVLYLPSDGILFMGDLLFVRAHPFLCEGDPQKLIDALQTLNRFEASCFVPGHGGLGTHEDVASMIEYVEYCMKTAKQNLEDMKTNEDLESCQIPEKFGNWIMPQMFLRNLKSICERITGQTV